ncbi:MAG: NrfD/PsrC family molybdoenzyme membrane anchor subunit [Candidatus Sumerlaeaceae bacterium]
MSTPDYPHQAIPDAAEQYKPYAPPPVVAPGETLSSVTHKIADIVLQRNTPRGWVIGFLISSAFYAMMLMSIAWLLYWGVGVWGNNIPVAWAFDIINFVWWIGIGHAGTLISAILLLFRQQWRTSINRFAEAMTLFAVACAGLFPLLHTGRPWYDYFLLPYINTLRMWPQFRSPLVWDVFAVSTYGTVSLLFWYVGLIPDLATMRDRVKNPIGRKLYGAFALGWRGSARHWHRYEKAYLILAGLSTPLVLSVHSVISFDFSVAQLPGWHATIFPPYFVAGAIFAGFAMVLTLMIPVRWAYGLHAVMTDRHLQNMAKVMLVAGLIVAYGYFCEAFYAWYSGSHWERYMMINRVMGPMGWAYWLLILTNILIPQLLWIKPVRSNVYWLFAISMSINVGMWLERFVIIVVSLSRDFLPSSWAMYEPTRWDFGLFFGTIGQFMFMTFLFIRLLPMISVAEVRHLLPESKVKLKEAHH